jgi:hypothetical protein
MDTPDWDSLSPAAPSPQSIAQQTDQTPSWDDLQPAENRFGGAGQAALTALEQGASGATLGLSKKLETATGLTTPEAISGREATNPGISTAFNILGTGAMLYGTGGLGAFAEGAGTAAKLGIAAAEGAGIGGINQATDDWSQNKPLDANKIMASAGMGALLGGGVASLLEGAQAVPGVKNALGRLWGTPETEATAGSASSVIDASPSEIPLTKTGVQPTTYQNIVDKIGQAKADNTVLPLPQKSALADAISRVEMLNPVNPLQLDSLSDQGSRDFYNTAKELPGNVGDTLKGYEALQKSELVGKTGQTIADISPGTAPVSDAVQGGKAAINAFTDQYQAEKEALKPIFETLKSSPITGDTLSGVIGKMTEAVPGISEMFDTTNADIAIKPYKTSWGIDKSTYNAVKEATESLKENPSDFQSIWNIRKGLDQHIDTLAQGQAPSEIRALKASMMDYMQQAVQDSTPDINVRDAFRRYAINEQQRNVIEKAFGASIGTPEFGAISKVKPELIGDRIFGNTANVSAAKQILPPKKFNQVLANWLSEAKEKVTDNGAFSSNKFGSFLRNNQDSLNAAFSDNPSQLQRLKDLTTIMRILPDSPSINPAGTAKTFLRMIGNIKMHDMTWEGIAASIPQKILGKIEEIATRTKLNDALAGRAQTESVTNQLKKYVNKTSEKVDRGIRSVFTEGTTRKILAGSRASSGESRKIVK